MLINSFWHVSLISIFNKCVLPILSTNKDFLGVTEEMITHGDWLMISCNLIKRISPLSKCQTLAICLIFNTLTDTTHNYVRAKIFHSTACHLVHYFSPFSWSMVFSKVFGTITSLTWQSEKNRFLPPRRVHGTFFQRVPEELEKQPHLPVVEKCHLYLFLGMNFVIYVYNIYIIKIYINIVSMVWYDINLPSKR